MRSRAVALILTALASAGAMLPASAQYWAPNAQPVQFSVGGWITCANEGQICNVPYPTLVRFGANGVYSTLQVSGPVRCQREIFGDPLDRIKKVCQFRVVGNFPAGGPVAGPARGFRFCANEGEFCAFGGTARVYYGSGNRMTSNVFRNGAPCNNQMFGDPAPGQHKACYLGP